MGAPIEPPPWYRQFWPWFLIALPATSVVAGLSTLWIAIVNQDALVSDDWYKDGTVINRRLELEEVARERDIVASFRLEGGGTEVALSLEGRGQEAVEWLSLTLSHPTQEHRDRILLLQRSEDGRFVGRFDESAPEAGRWYAKLEPVERFDGERPRAPWRISETVQLPSPGSIVLGQGG